MKSIFGESSNHQRRIEKALVFEECYKQQNRTKLLSPHVGRNLFVGGLIIFTVVHIWQDLFLLQLDKPFRKREIVDSYSRKVHKNIRNALLDGEIQSADVPPFRKIGKEQFEVVPAYRLSHCRILKSMSTVLTNMMCYMYNSQEFVQSNKSISTGLWNDRVCEPYNRADSFMEMQRRLPFGFNSFAVVREPLSRFVSGYLDQCFRKTKCLNCTASDLFCILLNLKKSLSERAEHFMERPYSHALVHLAPQTWYCNMSKIYESTAFIKYGSGVEHDKMVFNILEVLKTFGVVDEQLIFIKNDLMNGLRTKHSTESWTNVSEIKDLIRKNNTLFSLFMDIFRFDYAIFDFPLPPQILK